MPRTAKALWPELIEWDNLLAGWREARKGKRYKPDVLRFHQRWEEELIDIQNRLVWDMWEPQPFTAFYVYEPKQRLIEAPPFRDRVVHHALHRVVEPYFERRFIRDSFACRSGRGTHAACQRVQQHLRRAQGRWGRVYALQADIRRYFPSIHQGRLKQQIGRTIGDRRVLGLWGRIIDAQGCDGVGLPIGALTSQLAANVYLDALDHHVKDEMGEPFYVRYMDDWLFMGPDKAELKRKLDYLRDWLASDLGLRLSKWSVYPASQGVDFAGYRTWATHIKPRKRNTRRARRRMKQLASGYRAGRVSREEVRASVASYVGYTKHCQGRRTMAGMLSDLKRDMGL